MLRLLSPRLSDDSQRATTQAVMAHGLDQLLRLLHPDHAVRDGIDLGILE